MKNFSTASYLRIDSLPPDEQAAFQRWLLGQTCPVIPTERDASGLPASCAYPWDYARWVHEGKPASLSDPFDT